MSRDRLRRSNAPFGLLLLLPICLVSGLYYCSLPPTPDQSIFDYIGYLGTQHLSYYRDAFDISWPAPFLIHQGGVTLFGIHGWTARLTDLCLLPMGMAGIWLVIRHVGSRSWANLAVLIYPPIYVTSGGWMAGHRDIVAMHQLLLAVGLLMVRPRLWWIGAVAGALMAYATMMRPTYLLAAFLICAFEVLRPAAADQRLKSTAPIIVGLGLVFGAFLAAGLVQSSLADWYEEAVLFPATVYQLPLSRFRLIGSLLSFLRHDLLWLTLAALGGQFVWITTHLRGRPATAGMPYIWSLLLTVLVSYFVQNKGFGYHLAGLIPLLLVTALAGMARWAADDRRGGQVLRPFETFVFVCTALALVGGLGSRIYRNLLPAVAIVTRLDPASAGRYIDARKGDAAARVAIAERLQQDVRADGRVLQWGWNYEVLFLAQRRSATRFVNGTLLQGIRPEDPHFLAWLTELRGSLTRDRVDAIVLDTAALPGGLRDLAGPDRPSMSEAERTVVELYRQGYAPVMVINKNMLLERLPSGPSSAL